VQGQAVCRQLPGLTPQVRAADLWDGGLAPRGGPERREASTTDGTGPSVRVGSEHQEERRITAVAGKASSARLPTGSTGSAPALLLARM
jgi:hypothetical protein